MRGEFDFPTLGCGIIIDKEVFLLSFHAASRGIMQLRSTLRIIMARSSGGGSAGSRQRKPNDCPYDRCPVQSFDHGSR
jgi:hypothetical protein